MTEPAAPTEALDDTHYRNAFGELCERSVVSARSTIYAANGTKLLDQGARIDGALYARLMQHLLRDQIDQHIGIDGMAGLDTLEQMARDIAATEPLPRLLVAALGSAEPLLLPLRDVPLPASIALKLTLMRDQYPALLRQSLLAMLVALFLGVRSGLAAQQQAALAAAALLRDIGMLHMDPAWLAPQRSMSAPERRHLRAHPITSTLLLRSQGVYTEATATAVFEHHERLDGSGYPRGLRADALSPLGQILLLAELAAALAQKFGDAAPYRLGLVLQLNRHAFPAEPARALLAALKDAASAPTGSAADAEQHFTALTAAFEHWAECRAKVPDADTQAGAGAAFAWVGTRLAGLRQVLTEAGSHPDQTGYLLDLGSGEDDQQQRTDAGILGREALWQIGSICREALQRWPRLAVPADAPAPPQPGDAAVAAWCHWVHRNLPGARAAAPPPAAP